MRTSSQMDAIAFWAFRVAEGSAGLREFRANVLNLSFNEETRALDIAADIYKQQLMVEQQHSKVLKSPRNLATWS